MFNSITIRTRLILTMSVLGLMMLALGGLSIFGMNTVNFALKDVYSNQMASTVALGNAKNFLNRARFVIDRGVFHPEAPDLEKTLGRAEGFMQDGEKAWKAFVARNFQQDSLYGLFRDKSILRDSVVVQFIVRRGGGISNLQAITGVYELTKEEARRLLLLSCPYWVPAVQSSGVSVTAWHRQTFIFEMNEENGKVELVVK